jgi:DNA-binding response OmpR family regulator
MLGDDFIKLEMDLGASAALRKPFRREQLIAAVNRVLAQKTDVARPTSFPEG